MDVWTSLKACVSDRGGVGSCMQPRSQQSNANPANLPPPLPRKGALIVNIQEVRGLFFRDQHGNAIQPDCWVTLRLHNNLPKACKTSSHSGGADRRPHQSYKIVVDDLESDLFATIHSDAGPLGTAIVPLHRFKVARAGSVYIDEWFHCNFQVPIAEEELKVGSDYPADPFVVAQIRLRMTFIPENAEIPPLILGKGHEIAGQLGKLPQKTGRPLTRKEVPPSATNDTSANNNNTTAPPTTTTTSNATAATANTVKK